MKPDPIPQTATDDLLDDWLEDERPHAFLREQTALAAIGYLGMCRHAYLSPDWVAHNCLWQATNSAISDLIDHNEPEPGRAARLADRIARTYRVGWGLAPTDNGAHDPVPPTRKALINSVAGAIKDLGHAQDADYVRRIARLYQFGPNERQYLAHRCGLPRRAL